MTPNDAVAKMVLRYDTWPVEDRIKVSMHLAKKDNSHLGTVIFTILDKLRVSLE